MVMEGIEMRKGLYSLAVVLLLGAPQTSQAVGSFTLTSSDLINASTVTSSSSVAILSGLTFATVTVGTVSLALELEEMAQSLQSPHHNAIIITSGVNNTANVASNTSLVTVQQTAGGANVTLSVNSIIAGGAGLAATSAPTIAASNDPTMLLALAANPAFTILNSFPVAQALLLREAFKTHTASSASQTSAIAIDIINVGVSEFSPHHNAVQTNTAVNSAAVTGNSALVQVQLGPRAGPAAGWLRERTGRDQPAGHFVGLDRDLRALVLTGNRGTTI
jgi:hypothetical protein